MTISQLPTKHRELYIPNFWSKSYIQKLIDEPSEPEDYPNALLDIENCLNNIEVTINKKILVIGSITPWIECFLLKNKSDKVYTTDINRVTIEDDRIIFYDILKIKELQPDIIISFSVIEHIGLGRYGDQIDENGDIDFMKNIYNILNKNSYFILGVPIGIEYKCYNPWHRIYDSQRLKKIINSFNIIMSSKNGTIKQKDDLDFTINIKYHDKDWQNQPAILLQK